MTLAQQWGRLTGDHCGNFEARLLAHPLDWKRGQKEENPEGCGGKRVSAEEKAPLFPGHIEFLEQPTNGQY